MQRTNPQLQKILAERFRLLRGDETLDEFHARLGRAGLKVPKWNRYENEKETPSIEKIFEICDKLDISPTWLFFRKGFQKLSDVPDEIVTAADIGDFAIAGLEKLLHMEKPRPKPQIFELVGRYRNDFKAGKVSYVPQVPDGDAGASPPGKISRDKK